MAYFRNVENDGVWQAGESYTFEVWTRESTFPYGYYYTLAVDAGYGGAALLTDEIAFADGYTISPTTWTWAPSVDYPWEGDATTGIQVTAQDPDSLTPQQLADGAWIECTVTIDSDLAVGDYSLVHAYYKMNADPYTYTLLGTTRLNVTITAEAGTGGQLAWPKSRAVSGDYDYVDPDTSWDGSDWATDPAMLLRWGGYHTQIVAVAHNKVYFSGA